MKHSRRLKLKRQNTSGTPPGNLFYTGSFEDEIKIYHVSYTQEKLNEQQYSPDELSKIEVNSDSRDWTHIMGVHSPDFISKLGDKFSIHPLILEDIMNTSHSPKLEIIDGTSFFILKLFRNDGKVSYNTSEQLSILISGDHVMSFQESSSNFFMPIYERLRKEDSRLRKNGMEYLLYALLDVVLDQYLKVNITFTDKLIETEDDIFKDQLDDAQIHIYESRNLWKYHRDYMFPLKEILYSYQTQKGINRDSTIKRYHNDLNDHALQIIKDIQNQQDQLKNLHELHLTNINTQTNLVMRRLTIIATIFIPLTFIAGVYGMNFDYMPELHLKYGYFYILGVMGIVGAFMYYFIKRI